VTRDELITALEAAPVGIDILDRAIATHCQIFWDPSEDGNFGGYNIMPKRCHFTRSIDAALMLVPEGYAIQGGRYHNGRGWWHIYEKLDGVTLAWAGHAATPAIALCIAALKARP
jgi:hypothetical protein